jgi:hypothetical protein
VLLINKYFSTISAPLPQLSFDISRTEKHFYSTSTILTTSQAIPVQETLSDGFTMIKRLARIKGNTYRLSWPG